MKQCCAKVHDSYGVGFHPCSRKSRVDRDGKPYCLQHDPVVRKAKSDERMKAWQAKWDASDKRAKQQEAALQAISTLNALGYDGEQCVRELPEIMKQLDALTSDCTTDSPSGVSCPDRTVLSKARAILAKCKAKGGAK